VVLHSYAALMSGCIFLLIANAFGVYKPYLQKRNSGSNNAALVSAWAITFITILLVSLMTKTSSVFSRLAVFGWFFLVLVVLILSRVAIAYIFSVFWKPDRPRNAAVVGCGASAIRFMGTITKGSINADMKLVGVYSSEQKEKEYLDCYQSFYKGGIDTLVEHVKSGLCDEVYIALSMSNEDEIIGVIDRLSDCSVPVYFIPDIFTVNLMISQVFHLEGTPVVSIYDTSMDGFDNFLKRIEDVFIGGVILAVILFPMLIIALSIKLTSRGPVIFKQRRYGLGGELIEVWKFRSMTVCDDGDVIVQAKQNDMRITPLGAFLRSTSLDELPQFFNVLKGDMSIVGPRPHAVAHNELYRKEIHGYMLRHLVKPGITGWAQVNGWRGETDTLEKMQKRVEYDLEYIKNWSLWFDLKIIVLTIAKGFVHKNAY